MQKSYTFQQVISESTHSKVFRGIRKKDAKKVLLKQLKKRRVQDKTSVQLHYEHKMIQHLDVPSIIRSFGVEHGPDGDFLVLEDQGGTSLDKVLTLRSLGVQEVLTLAIKLTEVLTQVHAKGIIHKDVKPENIIVLEDNEGVSLADFGIASFFSAELDGQEPPEFLEGSLPYMAPEQTGRMNRSVDQRTDYYSLGVTLYQLLTGELPFKSKNPMELLHCHIARVPNPPHVVRAEIPEAVSKVVMKLLAKTAEQRYQSLRGLRCDLSYCLEHLSDRKKMDAFEPGSEDRALRFSIPEKLYGRARELRILVEQFDEVAAGGKRLLMISGPPGIGKTVFVREINKELAQRQHTFLSGRFEQYKQDVPFASLLQAFERLLLQQLTIPPQLLEVLKQKLIKTLDTDLSYLVGLLPTLEKIVGETELVELSDHRETEETRRRAFIRLLQLFSDKNRPLVLFLDDLQWSDPATLHFLPRLFAAQELANILIVGVYRSNEVSESHPLMESLQKISELSNIQHIELQPLKTEHLRSMIVDSFACPLDEAESLAQLVFEKTHGNPFFARTFLKALYQRNLLQVDLEKGLWSCDLKVLKEQGLTDNVVDFMLSEIHRLPEPIQEILHFAAALGAEFSLQMLCLLCDKTPKECAALLDSAIEKGLLIPIGEDYKYILSVATDTPSEDEEGEGTERYASEGVAKVRYRFVHDRIQQASYLNRSEEERAVVHLDIAKALLSFLSKEEIKASPFELVGHLGYARSLLNEEHLRLDFIEIHLYAGQSAFASAAYTSALRYLSLGIDALTPRDKEERYDLVFSLFRDAARAAYISGETEMADRYFEEAEGYANNQGDKVDIYLHKIDYTFNFGRAPEAVATGFQTLQLFNVKLSRNPSPLVVMWEFIQAKRNIRGRTIDEIVQGPVLEKPEIDRLNNVLVQFAIFTYHVDIKVISMAMMKITNNSLKYGNSPLSAYGYSFYSVLQCVIFGDLKKALELAKLAIAATERFPNKIIRARTNFMLALFTMHWHLPFEQCLKEYILVCRDLSRETGDVTFATLSEGLSILFYHSRGMPLDKLMVLSERALLNMKNLVALDRVGLQKIIQKSIQCLRGQTEAPWSFNTETVREEDLKKEFYAEATSSTQFYYPCIKLMLCYIFGQHEEGEKMVALGNAFIDMGYGVPFIVDFYTFGVLNDIILSQASKPFRRKRNIKKLLKKLKIYAESCPANYECRYLLAAAEFARMQGHFHKASQLFSRSISSAERHGAIHYMAFASELAAKFYWEQDDKLLAETFYVRALDAYRRWGAPVKVDAISALLDEHFARTIPDVSNLSSDMLTSSTTTATTRMMDAWSLDFQTVIKSTQTISQEILLDKLLETLLHIMMENAGARRGILLLQVDKGLRIEAEGQIEPLSFKTLQSIPLKSSEEWLCTPIVHYVAHTSEEVLLGHACKQGDYTQSPYVQEKESKSILCIPILRANELVGILYLENDITSNAFTRNHITLLKQLAGQAAISIKNAILYRRLDQARESAQQADRAKTHFLMNMGHELQTPLNAIVGYTELIAEEAEDEGIELFNEDLTSIQSAAKKLSRVLAGILELSRLDAKATKLTISSVELGTLIDEVLEETKLLAQEKGHKIAQNTSDVIEIQADRSKLYYCVQHLLSYVYHSSKEQAIALQFSRQEEGENSEVTIEITASHFHLSEDEIPLLFEVFMESQSDSRQQINDLKISLAVSQGFCQLMGGGIEIRQESGGSTTFVIRLPAL